jgi:hypothetical protein
MLTQLSKLFAAGYNYNGLLSLAATRFELMKPEVLAL